MFNSKARKVDEYHLTAISSDANQFRAAAAIAVTANIKSG